MNLVLAMAGAAIGTAMTGGAATPVLMGMTGAQLGFFAGATLGNVLFPPSQPDMQGPRLSDLKVQVSTYGTMIPILYGTNRVAGNIIWATDLVEHKHTEDAGGKGGGGAEYTTYSYTVSFAVALCQNEISGIRKIWANGELIWNIADDNTGETGLKPTIHVHYGTETQEPDSVIEADKGVGNVPAYRGMAYAVFEGMDLTEKYGNRIPNLSFEVVVDGDEVIVDPTYTDWAGASDDWIMVRDGMIGDSDWMICDYHDDAAFVDYYWQGIVTDIAGTNPTVRVLTQSGALATSDPYIVDAVYIPYILGSMGQPILINQIWMTLGGAFGNEIYVMDADTRQVQYLITTPFGWTGEIFHLKKSNQILVLKENVFGSLHIAIYDLILLDGSGLPLLNATLSGFTANQTAVVGDWNYDFFAVASAAPYDLGIKIFNQHSYALVDQFAAGYGSVDLGLFDPVRRRFVFGYGSLNVITWDESNSFVEHTVWGGTNSSVIGSVYYLPSVDKYLGLVTSAFGKYYAVINPDTWEKEYDYFTAAGYIAFSGGDEKGTDLGNGYFLIANGTHSSLLPIYPRLTSNTVTLSSIVSDICSRCGLSASDIDVTQLTDEVLGFSISQQMNGRSAIEGLQPAYFFDAVESA